MTSRPAVWLGVLGIVVVAASLRWLPGTPVIAYAATSIGSSVLFLALARSVAKVSMPRAALAGVLVLLFLLRAAFLFTTPIGSDDVYRYLWDGKVQAAGINPYRHAPEAQELVPLHSETIPRLVNHPRLKTPYFPVAQWAFRIAYGLSGEAVWGIKTIILLAEALTVAGLVLLLRQIGQPTGRVLLYAAAPLPIFQFAVDAHIDAVGFPFLVFGLLLYLRRRTTVGLLLLGLSMSVKPVAIVILPFLAVRERDWRSRMAVPLIPAMVLGLQFLPYLGSPGVFDGIRTFARDWMFNGAVFSLVLAAMGDNQRARVVCGFLYAGLLGALALRGRDVASVSVYAVLLLLVFSPVVHPWYVGWLAVLLPLAPRPSALWLVGAVSLTSLTVVTYQSTGVWIDYPLVRLVEWVPTLALLSWELRNGDTHLFHVSSS